MRKRACRAHGPLLEAVLGREQDSAHWPLICFFYFPSGFKTLQTSNICASLVRT
jgi:hypothetical protein